MGLCFSFILSPTFENVDSSIQFFSFDGYKTKAKVVYIYDGDSVHIVLPLKETKQLVKIKTRLYGIDTPELRNHEQKAQAIQSKNRLIELLNETQNVVHVECGQFDKYGRVLVTLFSEKYERSLNQILIDEGHAYEYYGKTKRQYNT